MSTNKQANNHKFNVKTAPAERIGKKKLYWPRANTTAKMSYKFKQNNTGVCSVHKSNNPGFIEYWPAPDWAEFVVAIATATPSYVAPPPASPFLPLFYKQRSGCWSIKAAPTGECAHA